MFTHGATIIIIIINLFYQFGTGGHTQKARPVQGAYCLPLFAYVCPCLFCYLCLSK